MEGRQNHEELEIHIFTDDSPSPNTSNTASFPAMPDNNSSEQDTDGYNTQGIKS